MHDCRLSEESQGMVTWDTEIWGTWESLSSKYPTKSITVCHLGYIMLCMISTLLHFFSIRTFVGFFRGGGSLGKDRRVNLDFRSSFPPMLNCNGPLLLRVCEREERQQSWIWFCKLSSHEFILKPLPCVMEGSKGAEINQTASLPSRSSQLKENQQTITKAVQRGSRCVHRE